ncbi:MAG: ATPase [Alphaproteobacteria bacterium]|nr:ATPase [Alphaproteobacteria bacterium]
MNTPRPRRFWKVVSVVAAEGGFGVALDGRPIRTPARAALVLPTRAMAEAVRDEWEAQGQELDTASLPLTRLANTTIDRVPAERGAVVAEIAGYGRSDLLCYRAEEPDALVARQAGEWDPLLDWLADRYGARLAVTRGILPVEQPTGALNAVLAAIAACDDFILTGLHATTSATGSVVIALAVLEARLDAEAASALSLLDERFQAERWGDDAAAAARRARLRADIAAGARFMALAQAR